MRGIGLFTIPVEMPEVFSYSFDGKLFYLTEQFKPEDKEVIDRTITFLTQMFGGKGTIGEKDGMVTVIFDCNVNTAVLVILSEMINQAYVRGIINGECEGKVLGALLDWARPQTAARLLPDLLPESKGKAEVH